jgi:hypothetical protein
MNDPISAYEALASKRVSTLMGFFNATEAQWRLMTLRRQYVLGADPGVSDLVG